MLAFKRLYKKFRLPPALAQSGAFNREDGSRMVDPLVQAAQVAALSRHAQCLESLSQRKRWADWPLRQYLYMRLFFDDFVGVSTEIFELRYTEHAKAEDAHASIDDDGVTRVVLRSIEERVDPLPSRPTPSGEAADIGTHESFGRAGHVLHTARCEHMPLGATRRAHAEIYAPGTRRRPWTFGSFARHNGREDGRGLLSAAVISSDSGIHNGQMSLSMSPGRTPSAEMTHSIEHATPLALRPANPSGEMDVATGQASLGPAWNGFSSPSGRVRDVSPTSSEGKGTASGRKRWDVGGWLVERGEMFLQRL